MDRSIKLYELDNGLLNSTQRNNQYKYDKNYLHINSNTTCNVTSMCMALEYLGYSFPEGIFSQPEDNLAKFMVESSEVNSYYQSQFPSYYNDYANGNSNCYSPMELHAVLSAATNLWMGEKVTEFVERPSEPFDVVLKENIINNKPLVISGTFNGLNHVVCLTGIITIDDKIEFVKIDDPYGNYRKNYNYNYTGNDVWLTYDEAMAIFKPFKTDYKMYHKFL